MELSYHNCEILGVLMINYEVHLNDVIMLGLVNKTLHKTWSWLKVHSCYKYILDWKQIHPRYSKKKCQPLPYTRHHIDWTRTLKIITPSLKVINMHVVFYDKSASLRFVCEYVDCKAGLEFSSIIARVREVVPVIRNSNTASYITKGICMLNQTCEFPICHPDRTKTNFELYQATKLDINGIVINKGSILKMVFESRASSEKCLSYDIIELQIETLSHHKRHLFGETILTNVQCYL